MVGGEDPWGWVDGRSGTYHTLTHDGNGADSAGGHAWSVDGVHWTKTGVAYTGSVVWANGSRSVLARRERPQVLHTTHQDPRPVNPV